MGKFKTTLIEDTKGLLSLYNAAHLLIPNESILEEAIKFTRENLQKKVHNLKSPLAKQVVRALKSPLPRFMKRLEARLYIDEYEEQAASNGNILKLAKLDFNFVQREHCKELTALSL
jgi:Terpene synthase, N-terminal domain